jgi:hypothetical protein
MAEKVGALCFWIGTGLAVLLIGGALFLEMSSTSRRDEYMISRVTDFVLLGVGAFLLGWAIRYVLADSFKK